MAHFCGILGGWGDGGGEEAGRRGVPDDLDPDPASAADVGRNRCTLTGICCERRSRCHEGGTPGSAVYLGVGCPSGCSSPGYPRERRISGSGVPLEVSIAGYPRERRISGSGVPLGVFIAGVPQGAPYIWEWGAPGVFIAGYPREHRISGSGVPLGVFIAGVPQGAPYIWEWGAGATPPYAWIPAIIRG